MIMAIGVAMIMGVSLAGAPSAGALTAAAEKSFIAKLVLPAQQAQQKYGVPASVSIAQAIQDSAWGTSKPATSANNPFSTRCTAAMTAAQFIKLAQAQVGKPYVLGAEALLTNTNPSKFDCSELVEWLYGRSGNPITDLAAAQYNATSAVSTASPKTGDLVFLRNNPARANGIGHVALVTMKLANGDWEVIEARGRAYGVVKTTLSYWKKRAFFAGMRRYAKLVFAGQDSVTASASNLYQSGCVSITSSGTTKKYSKFTSLTNAFYAHAAAVADDSAYAGARSVMSSVPKFVDAIAKVEHSADASAYAKKIDDLIDTYNLTDYDVVPMNLLLESGDQGPAVTALQYLLLANSVTVKATGTYDSTTVAAVKKFQTAKKLESDGQTGPITLTALLASLSKGATGHRVSALHALLAAIGRPTTTGDTFGTETLASVQDFQSDVGLTATGVVAQGTWAKLFLSLNPTPAPTVSGVTTVGQTLTATAGQWGPGSVSLAYQWFRGDKAIDGATSATYVLQPPDAGARLTVSVTGTKAGYTAITRTSNPTAEVATAPLTATPTPTITGKATVDQTLKAAPGTWAPAPVELGYQWYRGSDAIPGATKSAYTVQAGDAGATLKVTVTGTKPGYTTASTTSAATGKVATATFTATPAPKITGTPKVDQTLTADPGTWGPAPVTLTYQWYQGTKAIAGATKGTYTVQAGDAGATLKVTVTGTKPGYTTASTTSAATGKVATATLTATPTPKITGTAKVGKTLTADPGTWGPAPVTLTYQWYRGTSAISGATKQTYTAKSADKGADLRVRVRGSKAGYATVDKKSGATRIS